MKPRATIVGTLNVIAGTHNPRASYALSQPNLLSLQTVHAAICLEADLLELCQLRGSVLMADLWPNERIAKAAIPGFPEPLALDPSISGFVERIGSARIIDYATGEPQDLANMNSAIAELFLWWRIDTNQYLAAAKHIVPPDNPPPGLGVYLAFAIGANPGPVLAITVFRDAEYLQDFADGTMLPLSHDHNLGQPKYQHARCAGLHVTKPNLRGPV